MAITSTRQMVDELASINSRGNERLREQLHQALTKLVQLAKAEKWLEIKRDVALASGVSQAKK